MNEKVINNVMINMAMEHVNLKLEIEELKLQKYLLEGKLVKKEDESIEKRGVSKWQK